MTDADTLADVGRFNLPERIGRRLDFLDVARGAAALLVLVEPGMHACVPGDYEFSRDHVVIGFAAILVFFMVSGFVIPLSLEGGRSNVSFWLRRFFRLFPVYWLSIGVAFAYVCVTGAAVNGVRVADAKTWLANLALLQSVLKVSNVWEVFWTLPFEIMIYAVCSALYACGLLNRIGVRVFITLIIVFALIGVGRPLFEGKPMGLGGMRLVVLSAVFGMVAARHVTGRIGRGALYGLVAGLAAAVLLIWGVNHLLFPEQITYVALGRFAGVWGLAFAFFLGLLALRHRRMPALPCWVGRRSYPIYLLHPVVLLVLSPTGWPAWAFMPCLVGATLLLAELAHRFVERPGINLGRRIETYLLRPAAAPAPAVTPVAVATRQAA